MVNLIPHIARLSTTRTRKLERTAFALIGVYGAYRFWRRRELAYQAEVAKEFCPSELRLFSQCLEGKQACTTEMVYLHDCIYRQRGHHQVTFNQAKIR
mmetsp:Transcript_18774/g.34041  ORF Transcript_18774/g.34041 Transcript_18774/m.34041 type:complete len:98 (+) Transcript_18774:2936-3229(+)